MLFEKVIVFHCIETVKRFDSEITLKHSKNCEFLPRRIVQGQVGF